MSSTEHAEQQPQPKRQRAKKDPTALTLASFEADQDRRAQRKAWRDERRAVWRSS